MIGIPNISNTPTSKKQNRSQYKQRVASNKSAIPITYDYDFEDSGFDSYVDVIIRSIDASMERKYARSKLAHEKLHRFLKCLFLTFIKADKFHIPKHVKFPLNANSYLNSPTRYRLFQPGYAAVRTAYNGLLSLKHIKVTARGFYGSKVRSNRVTRIQPSQSFMEELRGLETDFSKIKYKNTETIVLRNRKTKRIVEYEDNDLTRSMRSRLSTINGLLDEASIDLPSEFLLAIRKWGKENSDYRPIDLTRKSLVRIFNDNFELGGRFYNGWRQLVPKQYRENILINGHSTVELDYKAFHPTLIYGREGLKPPSEPYNVNELVPRDEVKRLFNAMLNARNKSIREPKDFREKYGCSYKELKDQIEELHAPISKYFYSDCGVKLQNLDSKIAEYTLMELVSQNIPCLPIHDSFIVEREHRRTLREVMTTATLKLADMEIAIKEVGSPEAPENSTTIDPLDGIDIDEMSIPIISNINSSPLGEDSHY